MLILQSILVLRLLVHNHKADNDMLRQVQTLYARFNRTFPNCVLLIMICTPRYYMFHDELMPVHCLLTLSGQGGGIYAPL